MHIWDSFNAHILLKAIFLKRRHFIGFVCAAAILLLILLDKELKTFCFYHRSFLKGNLFRFIEKTIF